MISSSKLDLNLSPKRMLSALLILACMDLKGQLLKDSLDGVNKTKW